MVTSGHQELLCDWSELRRGVVKTGKQARSLHLQLQHQWTGLMTS